MIHQEPSPLSGQTVKLKEDGQFKPDTKIQIHDYWDRVNGQSWKSCNGTVAVRAYGLRVSLNIPTAIPLDDEVLYGLINNNEALVHVSELDLSTTNH